MLYAGRGEHFIDCDKPLLSEHYDIVSLMVMIISIGVSREMR